MSGNAKRQWLISLRDAVICVSIWAGIMAWVIYEGWK